MQSRSSGQRGRFFCHTDGGTKELSSMRGCTLVEDGSLVPTSCDKGTVPNRNFQIHANLPVSVPAPTSDRVCPPLARSALRVVAYFPGMAGILSRCGYSVVGAIHRMKPGEGPVYQFFSGGPVCRSHLQTRPPI